MIVFLYGPDACRRAAKKKLVVAEFLKKHTEANVQVFDFGSERVAGAFADFIRNQSIFDPMRLAVLESVFDAALENSGQLKEIVSSRSITALISEESAPPKPYAFLKRSPALCENFPLLRGREWESFVAREARERGVELAPAARKLLTEAYIGDTWRLATELDKMRVLKKTVDRDDLDALDVEIAPNFWGLVQQFKTGGKAARLAALQTMEAQNNPAAKIFNILAASCPERVGDFARADIAVKSGKLGYEEALVELALK